MATAVTYSATGTKKEQATALDKAIFGVEANHQLLDLAYRSYLAAARSAQARTLTRGLVRGGGRKPWRQKGTGRARVGSIRVPQWRGGGVTFGPTGEENHAINLNQKMRRQSIAQALSLKAKANQLVVIEKLDSKDGKTKGLQGLLGKLKLKGGGLVVIEAPNQLLERAAANLAGVELIYARSLNTFSILNADWVLMTAPALEQVKQWLGGKNG
jgi:large subunit ribosomal protein L4